MNCDGELIEVGATVRLSKVAEQIAEIEGGDADILWVMRLCIDRGVRICIKIAEPIYVWRWERDPGFYADLPVMGMGDYIEPMTGVAFLFSSTLETLIIDRVAKCNSLYLTNDLWDGGLEHLYIASQRHFLKQSFAEELKNKNAIPGLKRIERDMQAMIDRASDTDYLVIDTNDLYMSKKDVDKLFNQHPQKQDLEDKQEASRISTGRHAANIRWRNEPKAYAMCKAYEEWLRADKSGGYRSKLAAYLLENVDGISGILVNQKYLAEKFSKWERGEELPEC